MAYDFSLSGIQQAQQEVNEIGGNFEKTAAQIHTLFESIRKKQLEEINVCTAQISQLNTEMSQAQQAIDSNTRLKAAAEAKISRLEAELRKLEAQLEKAKKTLNSLKSQYSSCSPPSSTGNAEMDSALRQAYQQQKSALQSEMASVRAEIADLEDRIEQIKREITRLKQIISKVNQNNPQLAKIKEECNATKHAVQTHMSKLKETKSNLFEKHDAFNTYYGYTQTSMNSTHQRVAQAFTTASMAVHSLNRLGSGGCDRVEMDENTLVEAIRVLEAYIGKLRESVEALMNSKNNFMQKLKDKISERVKIEMERIDQIAYEINRNIESITSTLQTAQSYLSSYEFLGN